MPNAKDNITLQAVSLVSPARGAYIHKARQVANITWFPCPDSDNTQCAFYEVPMNYTNPDDGDNVPIFMRKLPASAPSDQRLGSILVNPGGPGGSGSQWIAVAGQMLSTIIEGKYDLIGFDPRGVNLTGPSTSCFDSESKFLAREYQLRILGAPFPHLDSAAEHVAEILALQAGQGAACAQNGNQKMLRSVGTVAVAKDMAQIVEALGEGGLNYWGYSYGTILGSTFAALFPDLVNRMVLDGVSNAESYFNDLLQWGRDGMQDGPKVLTGFLSTCAEAGPEYCAFAVPRSKSDHKETTESLRKRVDNLFQKLGKEPLIVPDSAAGSGIIKASDLQLGFFGVFYSPKDWSDFAQALAQLERGDGSSLYTMLYSTYSKIVPKPYDQNIFNRSMQEVNTRESLYPVLCGDSSPLNITIGSYADYIRELGRISPVGEQWAVIGDPKETTESLRKRVDNLFEKLDKEPLIVPDSAAGSGIIKASDLQLGFFGALYSPQGWSNFAQALAQLERGDGSGLYTMLYSTYSKIVPKPYNQNIFNRSMQEVHTRESLYPVLCGDSSPLNITIGSYADYIRELGKISPVGEQWAVIGGGCHSWPFRAQERYTGPWTVEKGLKKTKFPILFVSGDADPVTPLASAVKMSSGFGNESATLLIQHGRAHPSLCTIKIIRDYFLDGKVPPNGTRCDPEPGYIYPANNTISERSVAAEDEDVLQTLKKLGNVSSKLVRRGF
ncbi:hypothetical protein RSAG8_09961, partial [Rhizoctonia solani AG-8 WAC10335]